jgi:hypothetical protein
MRASWCPKASKARVPYRGPWPITSTSSLAACARHGLLRLQQHRRTAEKIPNSSASRRQACAKATPRRSHNRRTAQLPGHEVAPHHARSRPAHHRARFWGAVQQADRAARARGEGIQPHSPVQRDIEEAAKSSNPPASFSAAVPSVHAAGAPNARSRRVRSRRAGAGHLLRRAVLRANVGRRVERATKREYGIAHLVHGTATGLLERHSRPHAGVDEPRRRVTRIARWAFDAIGTRRTCPFAAIADPARKLYGVQFHPEVVHTPQGRGTVEFRAQICGCPTTGTWATFRGALPSRNPQDRRRQEGAVRAERRRGFQRGGGLDSQGHRRPAHLRIRQQRPVAQGRTGTGAARVPRQLPDQSAITWTPRTVFSMRSRA